MRRETGILKCMSYRRGKELGGEGVPGGNVADGLGAV